MKKIILASSSPRRKELLGLLGVPFDVVVPEVDETPLHKELPSEMVQRLAELKAKAVKNKHSDQCIIAADTVVVLNSKILGKPLDACNAVAMLQSLAGTIHHVFTGMVVLRNEELLSTTSVTEVEFSSLSLAEIEAYVATGEPSDKAGAYGIQGIGSLFIKRINGSYTNVVGLDLVVIKEALLKLGVYELRGYTTLS
jgi:septum formation protein